MADRRRRSPEVSNKKREESQRAVDYDEQQQARGMRTGAGELIYSSSASSFEIIDISHSFPPNRSGIKTFFTAPSERRLRKRRSSRLLRHSNSSSESVGDLAYGHGYLRRPKRKVRSRKGKEIDRERYSEREREREHYTERYSDREREKIGTGHLTTDAEILAVGAGLAKLAREQNKLDLKNAARNGKQVFAAKEFGRRDDGPSRGLGPSKISHGSDTVDEDGWESASDAHSESSVDSRLAFGEESQGGWGLFGRKKYTPQSRKNSVVDPRLFGPANSLHGVVTQPVGFGEVHWNSSSDFGSHPFAVPSAGSIAGGSQPSLQHVYPIATEDSTRFEAGRTSVASGPELYGSSRPDPIPIQQPQPFTPVSQSVYEPIYGTRSETGSGVLKKTPTSSGRGKSLAEAALFGVAGAAVGAAIASERKDDRKDRRRDDDRDTRDEDRTPKRRDSDRKGAKDDRKRDKRDSPNRDERKEKRRDKERTKDSADDRKDKKREKRRDEPREDTRDERRERHREERRSERGDDQYDGRRSERSDDRYEDRRNKSEIAVSQSTVDPFQYQVDNDAFPTPNNEPATRHERIQSVPTVITVEREPDFTRKRSSLIEDIPVSSRSESGRKDYAEWDERGRESYRDSRDRPLHEAESIYQETEHFTAPIDAAAISAAIAAENYRESRSEKRRGERRGERRSDYDDYDYKPRETDSKRDSRDYDDYDRKSHERDSTRESRRERERDPIQEEADKAYREIVMARKIASQVIRSRSPSPNRSVVDKYEHREEEEVIEIVTPPGMDDHKKKGLYDAPNADFKLDHVLEDPREIRRFNLPSSSREQSTSDALYLKKDPDASLPRPLLNLVLPTPSPSPMPEKQAARSEPARPSNPEVQAATTPASDVTKGNVVPATSASTVSKGVTWGENETKHFEVESSSEHRDEIVSSPEMRAHDDPKELAKVTARDSPAEQPKSATGSKRSGWGAITAGIIGASAGAAAASSSETSKTSKIKDGEKKDDARYEYRGVVVEPHSPPGFQRQQSPPSTGPKPSISQPSQSSHIPGAFDDDVDFTATVAAGLQDSGFDPNIVINDPKFRRRDSPPGTNESLYRAPYAETVSDLGSVMRGSTSVRDSQEFAIGDIATTPKNWPVVSPDDEDIPSKLSKKEQKRREKAKRQSGDFTPVDEDPKSGEIAEEQDDVFETKLSKKEQKKRDKEARRQTSQAEDVTPLDERSVVTDIVEEPESYFDEPKKKSKKSKKGSSSYDDNAEDASRDNRSVSVPVDAFDDLQNGEDDWSETKKSKRKSKRDSDRQDPPSQSAPSENTSPLERMSSLSKKSKDKSKRKSDSQTPDPTEISLPLSTPSENIRDGDFDDSRRSRKSLNKDSADQAESRSVVSEDAWRNDDDEPRKSKRKSKSRDDFDDTRSVASAPVGDEYDDRKGKKKDKEKKGSSFFGLFGSKSEVGVRDDSPKRDKDDFDDFKKKSKKSKRDSMPDASTLYGDMGSQSRISSNGNSNGDGSHHLDDNQDGDSRDRSMKNTRTSDESESGKKDSFLAKAGTLGAGVGLAGAAAAIAAQRHQQTNADNSLESNKTAEQSRSRSSSRPRQLEILDPDITQRQFRPSIDPQYGDLLPLPPSDPVSPNVEPIDDLPDLPDSRPDTPEADRLSREKTMASVRKSMHDTPPMKSPSQSAVPLKFIMSNRSNPSSPGAIRASPLQSPATPGLESQFPRARPRSWDSTKEYKPLYLVESNRRGSNVQQPEVEESLPALPPSQRTSRSSSQLDSSDEAKFEDAEQYPSDLQVHFEGPLSVDTGLAKRSTEVLDSQQSTPKASIFHYLDADQRDEQLRGDKYVDSSHSSLPTYLSTSPELEEHHDSHAKTIAEVIAGTTLVSSIGYFASSPRQKPTGKSFLDDLPSHQEVQPSPIEPMTKDRSSYLLQSSPMSRMADDDDSAERVEGSPTIRQKRSQISSDVLHSIEERDGNDLFEQSGDIQPLIEHEREKTLGTLSSAHEPTLRETTHESEKMLPIQERDSAAIDAAEEVEPAEEFAFAKSKKDKKKDKKKGKGSSRSSTQDDTTVALPETSQGSFGEQPASVEAEPAELSLPKPKKDNKKGKGISRSSTQDEFSFEKPSLENTEAISTSADADPIESFSMVNFKQGKKKEKTKGKSAMKWEPEEEPKVPTGDEIFDSSASVIAPEEIPAQEDFIAADAKKSKKKDKKNRKVMANWEAEVEPSGDPIEGHAQVTSRDILETAVPVSLGIAAYEEFKQPDAHASSIQHDDKQKALDSEVPNLENMPDFQDQENPLQLTTDMHTVPVEGSAERQPLEMHQDSSIREDFVTSTLKKSKKKKGKSFSTWEPEEDQVAAPPVQKVDPIEEFEVPGSKKGKKKGKKSQSWTPEEVLSSPQPEPVEPEGDRELPKAESEELPVDESDQFATPGWPATPATPWATANEEVQKSPGADYFPSTATLHSPAKAHSSDNTNDRSYFPSAAAILPVTAAGVANFAADYDKKSDDKVVPIVFTSSQAEAKPSRSLEPDTDSTRPVPDGLTAGYDNDQLIHARQLQEEFRSGTKKSNKDKKKRQSLPATPDRGISRSRDIKDTPEDLLRARSLSIGPSRGTDRLIDRPMSEDRKNINNEGQLRREFESGKRSKKDRKQNNGLSRTSTQDNLGLNQPTEEPQKLESETIEDPTVLGTTENTRDGFDAGYQEYQLSLARQLQAEFGSGSKKSKKDKKRRSASQTPTQDRELQSDYFGDTPQIPAEEMSRDADAPESSAKGAVRDGLAVGYNETQLELARQLKEEFSSGSKKSKKDKKKRQSLLRNTTEDDFSPDHTPEAGKKSRNIDHEDLDTTGPSRNESEPLDPGDDFAFDTKMSKEEKSGKEGQSVIPATTDGTPSESLRKDPEEPLDVYEQEDSLLKEADGSAPAEFEDESALAAFTTKKSIKDKKGKKRESFVSATTQDEALEEPSTKGIAETADAQAPIEAEPSEPLVDLPEDEFGLTRKKSKKDKKGKKRESLLRSTTDDAPSSDDFGKAVEALHNPREEPSDEGWPSEEAPAPVEESWASTTKRPKKDKKKRESLPVQEDSWDSPAAEGDLAQIQPGEELSTNDVTAMNVATQVINVPSDDFGFSSKKSKKDKKKRQSLLRASSTFDDNPEQQAEETTLETPQEFVEDATTHAPALANVQDDGFEFTPKKSQKEKKNRQSGDHSLVEERNVDEPSSAQQDPSAIGESSEEKQESVVETANSDTITHELSLDHKPTEQQLVGPAEEEAEAQSKTFVFSTKKSKKDKKKRKSLSAPDADEPSDVSNPIGSVEEAAATTAGHSLPSQNLPEIVEAVHDPSNRQMGESVLVGGVVAEASLPDPADEWGSFLTKKSKKNTKKHKLGAFTPGDESPLEMEDTASKDSSFIGESKEISEQVAHPVEDEWASFTTKKSKKDKTNRKSSLSTPVDGLPVQADIRSLKDVVAEQAQDLVDDEWGSSITKQSKKDRKKSKSGLSTSPEETLPVAAVTNQQDMAVIEEPKPKKLEDPVENEWGSFTTKKSKKDKKKNKSGPSTPLETLPEPDRTTSGGILDQSTPQLEEASAEPHFAFQKDFQETEELNPTPVEPVNDEWSSFTVMKSNKDKKKNKSGLSTPLEISPEPETSNAQQNILQAEEPRSQLDELLEGGAFTTKRSKDKRNKSEFSIPSEDASQPELAFQESQRNVANAEPHGQGLFVRPEVTSHQESRDVQEHGQKDAVDDDWGAFTTKKFKKGKKNKSGVSTPLEKELQSELSSRDGQVKEDAVSRQPDGAEEDECGSTIKTSKKDTKQKSGLSTPIEEISELEVISEEKRVDSKDAEPEQVGEREDELGSQTVRPPKTYNKNRSSGASTPLEETLQLEPSTQPNLSETEGPQSQLPSTENNFSVTPIDQSPQEAEAAEEASEFTTKKSKKDKMKQKSDRSTPVEEIVSIDKPEKHSQTQQTMHDALDSQPLPNEPQADQDQPNTAFDFATKTPKKNKKKRQSGLSTPIEGNLSPAESKEPSNNVRLDDMPETPPLPIEHDVPESQPMQDSLPVPPLETAEDGFYFTTKKSKKGKKAGKESGVSSESRPSTSVIPSTSGPQIDTTAEDQNNIVSERLTQSPLSFEQDLSSEQNTTDPDPIWKFEREAPIDSQGNDNAEFLVDLGRKPSKNDKRKRQATVANIYDDPGASQTPITSWADEVEEAEVERKVPVIQDIANDEALSHIASTTETTRVDDFSRPSKKGKKGKKRLSGLTQEPLTDESFHPLLEEDSLAEKTSEHNNIPILATTGAALAGAAFLANKSGNDHPEPSLDNETLVKKESDITPPTRKLSKKEKRKQSIDRRMPKDDPFDDPALWEGAKPRAFEESREGNDAGSDGFWSANNQDKDDPAEESFHDGRIPHQEPIDLFAPTRTEQSSSARHDHEPNKESPDARDLSRPQQQWNDLPDEYFTTSSKKDKKQKKKSRLAAWDTPQEQQESKEIEQIISYPPEPPKAGVEEPHVEASAFSERLPITPHNELVEESPVDRNLSFQDDQFQPGSSLRYSHQGSSSLPVVREETPAQIESEHFTPPSYAHGADDFNRDSAFVTDSPIPGQRPFTDEHIRDSGVHLRESSPLERTVAPVSTSDDGIAGLSWPIVDEASETVDLDRSQRAKAETLTTQHRAEERIAAERHPSHTPHVEERDFRQSRASEDYLHRHHNDRDPLPSQRNEESHTDLHRTQTIHRSPILEDERPHRHRVHRALESTEEHPHKHGEDRNLSSQSHEEVEKPHRHRVHRSHIPDEGKSDKYLEDSRSLPLQGQHGASLSDPLQTQTIHQPHKPDGLVKQRVQRIESPDLIRSNTSKEDKYGDLNTSQRPMAEKPRNVSDRTIGTAAAIAGATLGFAAAHQATRENRPGSGQSQRSSSNINRLRTPDPKILRPESVGSNRSSGTPPLRRSDRKSGDLRSLSQRSNLDLAKEAELAAITAGAVNTSSTAPPANPQANEGRVRAKEMADVYDGFGEGRMGSPRSPTRPHSMRRRQSMQVLDLESRLEQLAAENTALAEAKSQADRALQTSQHASSALVERDTELDSLKRTLAWLQNEVTRLTEVNDGLTSANITLGNQQNERYNSLESQHAHATRELQEVRDAHNNLSQGMERMVRDEAQNAGEDKDREIAELRAQLEAAKEQIREMQRQILESKAGDSQFLTVRDEDYFDNACQQLCQHVQQWVLRFSKFSDMRACRLTSEINNDKIIDRLDNAILDGSDVDSYLADRVKRRDVFMSMTMTMVWEFVFTRYLFGMDREQRQKLKSLEKLLSEVGPASAVHQWRATTLTLLSKREAFVQQREQDTIAVVNAVLETLTEILPPPSQLEQQIQQQLMRVMKAAVDLSIEMRTQRAEYMMLPPLQPEYDANGDLASKVSFNAALMNERSGDTVSNEELEVQKAVVRIVLFPLVVKKGDDIGEGDEEIVVCPAQVLVAKPKKQVRIFSNGSQPNNSRMSLQSNMPTDHGEGSVV